MHSIDNLKDATDLLDVVKAETPDGVVDVARRLFPNDEGFRLTEVAACIVSAFNDDMNAARRLHRLWLPKDYTFKIDEVSGHNVVVVYISTPEEQDVWDGDLPGSNVGRPWLIAILKAVIGGLYEDHEEDV